MRRGLLGLFALLVGLGFAGSAQAAAGPVVQRIDELFWAITGFALAVSAVVYGALIWFLIKYRRSVSPTPLHIEGNRKLEIVWTVLPTIILIIITAMSWPVLMYTDTPPPADTTVYVTAERFSWRFEYEDGNSTVGELWIQEDIVVHLDVTSVDVIHSLAIPQLGVKIDAIPDHHALWWLQADEPGDYLNQCAEFCGVGHYGMRATIHVFEAGSQPKVYGPPPQPLQVTPVHLRESGGNVTNPWSIFPNNLTFNLGENVTLRVWNDGTSPYDFRIDLDVSNNATGMIPPFESRLLTLTLNATSPSPVPYGPSDPAARDQGMVGYISIRAGRVIAIAFHESGCPPPKSLCLVTDPPGNPIVIAKGEVIVFELRNEGLLFHNFQMDYPEFEVFYRTHIAPNTTVFFGPFVFTQDASGKYWCAVPGHREGGMEADYVVGEGSARAGAVPIFELMAITFAVGVPATFAYVVHHARRRDEA